jgi:cytochrome c nitrite reductase small subunit
MRKPKIISAITAFLGASSLFGVAALGGLFGSFAGAAAYTVRYAEATSYLSDNPKTCTNCHIMNEQYNSWSSSPHHARATCNDCHVPHDNLFNKFYVKGENGYRHSKLFTLQSFHEPIQITPMGRDVVNENCVRCHEGMTQDIRLVAADSNRIHSQFTGDIDCIRCHTSVAHGSRR